MTTKAADYAEVLTYFDKLSNWGRWGPDDELGTINLITPEKRLRAVGLVKEGVAVSCCRLLEKGTAADVRMPLIHLIESSGERYAGHKNKPGELQHGTDFLGMILHGPSYTHLDALSHVFRDGKLYNNRSSSLVNTHEGATVGGVHSYRHGIMSRGVLLDIARLRGVDWMGMKEAITIEDLEATEKAQGVRVEEGDILFYRTGYYKMRKEVGPVSLAEGRNGFHPEVLPWLHERGVALLGGDTANDVIPPLIPELPIPVHQVGLVAMGLPLLDNANLEELAEACASRNRWEYLLTINPLPIMYATSSPINPIATF